MKLRLALVVALVAAGAAAWFVLRRPKLRDPSTIGESAHGRGIDRAMSGMTALYDAPEGKTPCETAYNALARSEEVAKAQHATPLVLHLAPRDEFLAKCGALPPATQLCLVPKHLRDHHGECAKLRPAYEVMKGMVELRGADSAAENEPPSR
jgi:hypothetical protein